MYTGTGNKWVHAYNCWNVFFLAQPYFCCADSVDKEIVYCATTHCIKCYDKIKVTDKIHIDMYLSLYALALPEYFT